MKKVSIITSIALLSSVFLAVEQAQAQQRPQQSNQLAPSVVRPTQDLLESVGRFDGSPIDTALPTEGNEGFAEQLASPYAAEALNRLNNALSQDTGSGETEITINGVRSSLEAVTIGSPAGDEAPTPANGASATPRSLEAVTIGSPGDEAPTTPAPANTDSTTPSTPANTDSTTPSSPQNTPSGIPVPNIPPLGNF